ncbi:MULTISPECIES: hypothetical protein [unclassified Streptomyces]|uniref:hypothetical protein n=1 Tax=unclassified Streptomyces TaxID=2593676 RepID=UPI0022B73585|nr:MULTISPECIES: hypothetical protein [unclassified Streptomyces]MCZ7414760.1 hypothetical protein [Streptomyces sp. WMMC897]MCZ7431683.1 hypothetical protein [Streptomyces sp. WMMC1477]
MAVEAGTERDERVAGRVWTVRLDPCGRPSAGAVKLSCSRPACPDQRFPEGTAAGRKAAVGHVNAHLAAIAQSGGPRGRAACACRAADCAWHTPDPGTGRHGEARAGAGAVRCGGPVVLTVYADRAGRLWRIAETCARCAAATADCRVLDTAATPAGAARATRAASTGQPPAGGTAVAFSDQGSGTPSAPSAGGATVPRTRTASRSREPRRAKPPGKIAQRTVPHDLRPDTLREELVELGDAFRAYQRRPEPDLPLLAELHDRKARAFALWAEASGDGSLHEEARRAEKAAQATREMNAHRTGVPIGSPDGEPPVPRMLTGQQPGHARAVLDHVRTHAPVAEPEIHLAVLMLTLRAARSGTANVTGQDLTGWLRDDAERVLERLAAAGWLRLPGTVADVLASRPEDPTALTVPSLLHDGAHPLALGKTTRSRISGWAQKTVGDRKIRKKKLPAAARLLALYTAAHTAPDGRLVHTGDEGLPLDHVAGFCALTPEQVTEHAGLLVTVDWLAHAETADGRLHGRLAERALPMGGLL